MELAAYREYYKKNTILAKHFFINVEELDFNFNEIYAIRNWCYLTEDYELFLNKKALQEI